MKTRIIGASLALILAVVGAFVLIGYVRGADARAQEGAELTDVYIVQEQIPRGTAGEAVSEHVKLDSVPTRNVVGDPVTDLADLDGLVADADLLPGEQLTSARFVDPTTLAATGDVPVPAGMQLLSFALPVERVVGGQVQAGDYIGLITTAAPQSTDGAATPAVTRFAFHSVLVTRVQGLVKPADGESTESVDQSSGAVVMLTIALSAQDAERWVYFTEGNATMWLTLETPETDNAGTAPVTAENAW